MITIKITGPSGHGKTHLALDLEEYIASQGRGVIVAEDWFPNFEALKAQARDVLKKHDVLIIVKGTK